MRTKALVVLLLALSTEAGCVKPGDRKIELDLSGLNASGLHGPPDGLRSLDYEFSIPDTPELRARVRAIDPTVRFHPGSRGRVGADPGECLCIGSTHQPEWRTVLRRLSALPEIRRIIRCDYE